MRDPTSGLNANAIFTALSPQTKDRLRPHVRAVHLDKGRTIHDIGAPVRHAFFPLSGLIALLTMTADADAFEVAMIGSDGIVGAPPFLLTNPSPYAAVVQVSCEAHRLSLDALLYEFRRGDDLQRALLDHADWLMRQVVQSAACHHYHALSQRLCRCLLSMRHTLRSETIDLTQEAIAQLLGLSRPKVSAALADLEDQHYIRSRHGRLSILNARALEACSCACQRLPRGAVQTSSHAVDRPTHLPR